MGTSVFYRAFLSAFLFLFTVSCAPQHAQADNNDFYLALLIDDSIPENKHEKIKLFESALSNSNIHVRQAASEQLAILMSQGAELSANTMSLVRREASSWWAEAFEIIPQNSKGSINKEKALSFLLESAQDTSLSYSEAMSFVLGECEKHPDFFTEAERAAINARYAAARLRYNEALALFRTFMTPSAEPGAAGFISANRTWTQQIPQLFIKFPNLINDLGRAFQYTSSTGVEGLNLFLQWETGLSSVINSVSANDIKYRLVFYAARIARRAGQNAQAISLFDRALLTAPDSEQNDACIWYLLDLSLDGSLNIVMEQMERYIPLLSSGNYVNDLMERHLNRLAGERDWARIIKTYDIIKNTEGFGLKSGFAWIIARAIQEGYLSAEERRTAAQIINEDSADPSAFMRIAYNTSDTFLMPALYYRKQSADALNLPFIVFSENSSISEDSGEQLPALKFILGFFENSASDFSVPYIRSLERNMTPDELRAIANALDEAENYPQSIRVITLYINNTGYERTRRDLELMYPRPYLELVETHARQFNIPPSLLYGLIRTESAFQSAVISHAGAVGLMQLMPATARDMADRIRRAGGPNFFGPNNSLDSTDTFQNVYIGSYYYNYLFNRFNNHQLALMSYNGGMTRVQRWIDASRLPVDMLVETVSIYETRDFGRRVPAMGRVYEELYY